MLELLSITTDPVLAQQLWALPGNTVFVDLEIAGKQVRQAKRDTVISAHTLQHVESLANLPGRGPLLVRTNPPGHGAAEEAIALLGLGVDRIMIPMFRTKAEVDGVVDAVRREADSPALRITLLAETVAALEGLEEIVGEQPEWVDHVHVGLNDLSLERGSTFLFEPVATGEIEKIAGRVLELGRRFGFGGIGMPRGRPPGQPESEGPSRENGAVRPSVPPEFLIGEHVRVGSTCVILSRAFHRQLDSKQPGGVSKGVERVRQWEVYWRRARTEELEENHGVLRRAIHRVMAGSDDESAARAPR